MGSASASGKLNPLRCQSSSGGSCSGRTSSRRRSDIGASRALAWSFAELIASIVAADAGIAA